MIDPIWERDRKVPEPWWFGSLLPIVLAAMVTVWGIVLAWVVVLWH